jgi:hypothetical protein
VGKQRREHILDQAVTIAKLIHVEPDSIKREPEGVVPTPEQMDALLRLIKKRSSATKARVGV